MYVVFCGSLIALLLVSYGFTMLPSRWKLGATLAVALFCLAAPQTQIKLAVDPRFAAGGLSLVAAAVALHKGTSYRWLPLLPVVATFGWILCSSYWSIGTGSYVATQLIFIAALFLFVLAIRGDRRTLAQALTGLAFLLLALTMYVAFTRGSASLLLAGRLRGPFQNPNTLAAVATITIPALATQIRRLHWLLWLVAYLLVWETGSRAALLAITAQLVVVIFGRLDIFGRLCALVSLMLAFIYYVPRILGAAGANGAGSSNVLRSNNSRDTVWAASRQLVSLHPVRGSGLGSYTSQFETGSSFYALWIQAGVIGLLLVGICITLSLKGRHLLTDWTFPTLAGGALDAIFEGWIIAAGTVFSVVFWSIICIRLNPNKAVVLENTNEEETIGFDLRRNVPSGVASGRTRSISGGAG